MAHRPRDPNQLAKQIVGIATGEIKDTVSERKKHPEAIRGRAGGIKGGFARADGMTPRRRSAIAKKAAETRWGRR